jgi:cytochrome b561
MVQAKLKYGPVAMGLHWVIAALILTNIGLAWLMDGHALLWDFDGLSGPTKLDVIQYHKSIGITVLLLSVLRLIWRLVNPPPSLTAHLAAWEKGLAHAVHWLFYVFMIGMPLAGWAMVSASPRFHVFGLHFWGLVDWPRFPGFEGMSHDQLKAAVKVLTKVHTDWIAWLGFGLIALHVAGALKHQVMDRDNELARMVPGLGLPGRKGIS